MGQMLASMVFMVKRRHLQGTPLMVDATSTITVLLVTGVVLYYSV